MSLLACFGKGKSTGKRKAGYLQTPSVPENAKASVDRVFTTRSGVRVVIKTGDITQESNLDAIVNAANERMLGGGGVDGAVHKAAGPKLLEACRAVPEVEPGVRCPTGQARITPGFALKARHVIHTVGPVYRSDSASAPLLTAAISNSLRLAAEIGLASISFPGISTGVYGYPGAKAAAVSIAAVDETLAALSGQQQPQQGQQQGAADAASEGTKVMQQQQEAGTLHRSAGCSLKEVRFVLFGDALYNDFVRAAETILQASAPPA